MGFHWALPNTAASMASPKENKNSGNVKEYFNFLPRLHRIFSTL